MGVACVEVCVEISDPNITHLSIFNLFQLIVEVNNIGYDNILLSEENREWVWHDSDNLGSVTTGNVYLSPLATAQSPSAITQPQWHVITS